MPTSGARQACNSSSVGKGAGALILLHSGTVSTRCGLPNSCDGQHLGHLSAFLTSAVLCADGDACAAVMCVGLEEDGSLASHPLSINRPIKKLAEVDNWFDSISYNKGAAVLRMLRAWVNRDNNAVTGLASNDDALSAGSGDDAKHASTSQQWAPHLRRLHDQRTSGSSSKHQARSWTAHRYSRGPSIQASISQPSTAAETDVVSVALDVVPAGAPVPLSAAAAADAPGDAVSVGSRDGWTVQQQQQGQARQLDGGAVEDKFMAGLGQYVKAHAYGNSNYTGLWDSIGEAAGEPVEQLMSTWTLRRYAPAQFKALAKLQLCGFQYACTLHVCCNEIVMQDWYKLPVNRFAGHSTVFVCVRQCSCIALLCCGLQGLPHCDCVSRAPGQWQQQEGGEAGAGALPCTTHLHGGTALRARDVLQ